MVFCFNLTNLSVPVPEIRTPVDTKDDTELLPSDSDAPAPALHNQVDLKKIDQKQFQDLNASQGRPSTLSDGKYHQASLFQVFNNYQTLSSDTLNFFEKAE